MRNKLSRNKVSFYIQRSCKIFLLTIYTNGQTGLTRFYQLKATARLCRMQTNTVSETSFIFLHATTPFNMKAYLLSVPKPQTVRTNYRYPNHSKGIINWTYMLVSKYVWFLNILCSTHSILDGIDTRREPRGLVSHATHTAVLRKPRSLKADIRKLCLNHKLLLILLRFNTTHSY